MASFTIKLNKLPSSGSQVRNSLPAPVRIKPSGNCRKAFVILDNYGLYYVAHCSQSRSQVMLKDKEGKDAYSEICKRVTPQKRNRGRAEFVKIHYNSLRGFFLIKSDNTLYQWLQTVLMSLSVEQFLTSTFMNVII